MSMNVAPIQSGMGTKLSQMVSDGSNRADSPSKIPDAGDHTKVSSAFGELLLRQMLDPVLEPVVKGLQGQAGGGGGIYGHLIKEALASSLAQGGTGGLSSSIERQFYPAGKEKPAASAK